MRASGILLPISSLPSTYGIGCFSNSAYEWVDLLEKGGQKFWQILPIGPTSFGDSPYQSVSTYAGNPYFISLNELVRKGLLTETECSEIDFGTDPCSVDYEKLYLGRQILLFKAFERSGCDWDSEFKAFTAKHQHWLHDYALFMAIKENHGGRPWHTWEEDIRKRNPEAMLYYEKKLARQIHFYEYVQYLFFQQWTALKHYANEKGIRIIGDIPIYVAFDSSDAWVNPKYFQFNEQLEPIAVAGCPPDAFSESGQLWGNPLYDWDYHRQEGFRWWLSRIGHCRLLYDVVRIDHFRGFAEYYSIPYGHEDAKSGTWEKGPGMELFSVVNALYPEMEIIAEDLGFMTDSVRELLRASGFPGMKVLQFAFSSDGYNEHLPHFHTQNHVVYTGTHDTETLMEFVEALSENECAFLQEYMDRVHISEKELCEDLIRLAMQSVADYCIIPMQDYLELGRGTRINRPSTVGGNWTWRLKKGEVTELLMGKILHMVRLYGR